MNECVELAAFLERLAARPIPHLSHHDKGRLHDASLELRRYGARESKAAATRAKRTILKADRAGADELEA